MTGQPLVDKAPGLTLGPFGQWFNRNETWAEQAKVWIDYLSRNSFLLQQGRFVADVIYFYGEDSNITALCTNKGWVSSLIRFARLAAPARTLG